MLSINRSGTAETYWKATSSTNTENIGSTSNASTSNANSSANNAKAETNTRLRSVIRNCRSVSSCISDTEKEEVTTRTFNKFLGNVFFNSPFLFIFTGYFLEEW